MVRGMMGLIDGDQEVLESLFREFFETSNAAGIDVASSPKATTAAITAMIQDFVDRGYRLLVILKALATVIEEKGLDI